MFTAQEKRSTDFSVLTNASIRLHETLLPLPRGVPSRVKEGVGRSPLFQQILLLWLLCEKPGDPLLLSTLV